MTESILPEIPRIYTAIAEWAACLIFIIPLRKKYSISVVCLISALFLIVNSIFLVITDNVPLFWWNPVMFFSYLMMAAYIYICTRVHKREALYYGIFAFIIAEFMPSLERLIFSFESLEGNIFHRLEKKIPGAVISGIDLFFVVLITDIILILFVKKYIPKDDHIDLNQKDLSIAFVMALVIFGASNISFISVNTMISGTYYLEIIKLHMIIDLAGIVLMYAHLVRMHETYIQHELEAVENVLQNQYQQYKQSRESIDLINYKYHDLKHQIAILRAENDPEKRNSFLNQMEDEIKQYELQNKTGNKVLDTVLTSKSMYCDKHGITLTSVADGSLLDFMDTMDICSIFGNALDNAIEGVLKIEDKEKRLIHLSVAQQKKFMLIRVENYFEGDINLKNGIFATSKKNAQFHGYGIKSIQYIAEKYQGAVNIDTDNNWFDLKILIPLK